MSITETSPAPAKRRARKAKPKAPAKAPEFAGMTVVACCGACQAARCVISERPYCAHPRKGGLQHGDMGNVETLRRFQRAQKMLGKKDIDKKFG